MQGAKSVVGFLEAQEGFLWSMALLICCRTVAGNETY